nr:PREDICTED: uncharacterized protein LOC108220937 [Daucus carota subsp. sativus]
MHDQKRKRDDDPPKFQNDGEFFDGFKQNNQTYNTHSFQQKNGNQGNQQNRLCNQSGSQSRGQTRSQNGGRSACAHCEKMHNDVCHWISGACFNYDREDHAIRDCKAPLKKLGDPNNTTRMNELKIFGRVFSLTAEDAANSSCTITGTLPFGNSNATVLFDTGVTHSLFLHLTSNIYAFVGFATENSDNNVVGTMRRCLTYDVEANECVAPVSNKTVALLLPIGSIHVMVPEELAASFAVRENKRPKLFCLFFPGIIVLVPSVRSNQT